MYNLVMHYDLTFINKVNGFIKSDFIEIIKKRGLDKLIGLNIKQITDVIGDKIEENVMIRLNFSDKIQTCTVYKLDKNIDTKSTIQPLRDLAVGNTLWLVAYKVKNILNIQSVVDLDFNIKLPKGFIFTKDFFSFKISNLNILDIKNTFNLDKNIC